MTTTNGLLTSSQLGDHIQKIVTRINALVDEVNVGAGQNDDEVTGALERLVAAYQDIREIFERRRHAEAREHYDYSRATF